MKRLPLLLLLLAATTCFAAEVGAKKVDLRKLYQSYVKAGYSTIDLPEFDKRVSVAGVVIEQSQGFRRGPDSARGGGLLKAGAAGSNQVLARLVARDADNAEKMEALAIGAPFKATCTVAYASGAYFVPLLGCVFD